MADQNFMDLASKTASGITGTDYMMLVNNSEAYKALVNDVAEAILGKLTSKSFSGLETTAKNLISAVNELNSKTRIKLIDINMTINDKTATIKYNISDTAIGLLLISGNIGSGVFFSIVINYGTKWSMKLLSFNSSNADTSSIVIHSDLGKITFNGDSKLESFYKVNGLLLY